MATKKKPSIPLDAGGLQWDKAGAFQPLTPEAPPAEEQQQQPSGLMRRGLDIGISALKGAVAVPEAAVGLADLATGGRAGKALESVGFRPGAARQMLDGFMTPEQQAAAKAVHEADGIIDTAVAVARNPSVLLHSIVESLPLMGASSVIGRGMMSLMPKMGSKIAAAVNAPLVASPAAHQSLATARAVSAGIGEGVMAMGSGAEQVRQQTQDGLLTGEQAGIIAVSGALTGTLGALGNKLAQRMGIADVDVLLVGKGSPEVTKDFVRRVLEGAVSEGLLEELPQSVQEQVAQNLALGKSLDEGVAQAAVLGTLAGGVMGAASNAFARTPGGAVRDTKMPENGPTTRALNAGIEEQAKAVDAATMPPPAPPPGGGGAQAAFTAALDEEARKAATAAEGERIFNQTYPAAAGAPTDAPANAAARAQREADKPPEPTGAPLPGDILTDSGKPFKNMRTAMRKLAEAGGEATHELVRVADGLVVRPKKLEGSDAGQPGGDGAPGTVDGARSPGTEQLRIEPDEGGLEASAAAPVAQGTAGDGSDGVRPDGDSARDDALTDDLATLKQQWGEAVKAGDAERARVLNDRIVALKQGKTAATTSPPDSPPDSPPEAAPDSAELPMGQAPGGAQTPKEQAAQAESDARIRAGDTVQTADGAGVVQGVAFGKVKVTIGGKVKSYPRAEVQKADMLTEAAHQAATSPLNDKPEPTDGQKEAGNYAKGHARISGMDIAIENPKGSLRKSKADAPEPWEVTMPAHYGYFKRTEGSDGDQVDLFIGDKGDNGRFWIVNQNHVGSDKHDEHKVVTGVDSADEAVALYKASFADNFGDKVFASVSDEHDAAAVKELLPKLRKAKPVEPAAEPVAPGPEPRTIQTAIEGAKRRLRETRNEISKLEDNPLASSRAQRLSEMKAKENAIERELRELRSRVFDDEPAAPSQAPAAEKKGETVIGRRADGVMIRADDRGVRFYAKDGVRIFETVSMRPTRDGIKVERGTLKPEFMTAEELAASKADDGQQPAAMPPVPPTATAPKGAEADPAPKPAESKPAPSANTIFTEDAAAAARARLKAKLGRAQSGIDPETMMDGITLAGYHIEKGARTFAAYARAMVDDLGDAVKPYLQSWYMAVRADPRAGAFKADMDKASAVEDVDVDAVLAESAAPAADPEPEQALAPEPPPAPEPAPEPTKPPRSEQTERVIELRKEIAVLEALKRCLAS